MKMKEVVCEIAANVCSIIRETYTHPLISFITFLIEDIQIYMT